MRLGMNAAARPFQAQADHRKSVLVQISPNQTMQTPSHFWGFLCYDIFIFGHGRVPMRTPVSCIWADGPTGPGPRRACHWQFSLRSRRSHREGPAGVAGPTRSRVSPNLTSELKLDLGGRHPWPGGPWLGRGRPGLGPGLGPGQLATGPSDAAGRLPSMSMAKGARAARARRPVAARAQTEAP